MQLLLASSNQARDSTSPIHSTTLPPPREGPHCAARMSDIVKLRVGGVVFEAEKETLLRFDHTFFHGLFSSGVWQPDADGAYFVDRSAVGFDRILEYLRSGKLRVEGLTQLEEGCVYSSLDYLLIPYKRQWHYATQQIIEDFKAQHICELKAGRLCSAYMNDLIVWNVNTSTIDKILMGVHFIYEVINIGDYYVCSRSGDRTIKLWNIETGECVRTLPYVTCILYMIDGRLCGSFSKAIRVWNILTGECEINIRVISCIRSLVQLSDGRICCGGVDGTLSIYNLLTGLCELSWDGHSVHILSVVCIDSYRICSGSTDRSIKVWNIATGECERTLKGHSVSVNSMVLMQDGRLCSSSYDGTIKLWNLETGECENTLDTKNECYQVLQLEDGRLLCACRSGTVVVWS